MIDWKVKLDKLLAEWRPKDSEVCKRDVHGIVPKVRVRLFADFLVMYSCEASLSLTASSKNTEYSQLALKLLIHPTPTRSLRSSVVTTLSTPISLAPRRKDIGT